MSPPIRPTKMYTRSREAIRGKKVYGNTIRTRPRPKHFWFPYCSLNALKVVPQCARTCLQRLYHYAAMGWLTVRANRNSARTELGRSVHLLYSATREIIKCSVRVFFSFFFFLAFCESEVRNMKFALKSQRHLTL